MKNQKYIYFYDKIPSCIDASRLETDEAYKILSWFSSLTLEAIAALSSSLSD